MHLKLPGVTFECMYIISMSIFNHVFALPFLFPLLFVGFTCVCVLLYSSPVEQFHIIFAIDYITFIFFSPSYFTTVNWEKMYLILGKNIKKTEASNMID